jgi:hypothetical protein
MTIFIGFMVLSVVTRDLKELAVRSTQGRQRRPQCGIRRRPQR